MILKAAKLCKGNIKTGKSILTWSKLYGNMMHYVERLNISVKGSCKCKYCKGCCKTCYVKKSYRHKSVIYGHAIRTIAMRYFPHELFAVIDRQLQRMRKKAKYVRIHQSGEYESLQEFIFWLDMSRLHPETVFYCYTKAFDFIIPYLLQHENELPDNFIILISIWHNYGIKEFNAVKHIKTVKAFVYDDRTFNYAAAGIDITYYCAAYDINGKLDHDETCDECQACMLMDPVYKVIGCIAH